MINYSICKKATSNFKDSDLASLGQLLKKVYNLSNIEEFNFSKKIRGAWEESNNL